MTTVPEAASGEGWETFSHPSDVGIRGRGPTQASAFERIALALTSVVTDPTRVRSRSTVEIECEAPDAEILLLDWVNALVYEMAARRMLFGGFAVEIEGERLRARASGENVDAARHAPAVEIKGATPLQLRVARDPDGTWFAQCVVDV